MVLSTDTFGTYVQVIPDALVIPSHRLNDEQRKELSDLLHQTPMRVTPVENAYRVENLPVAQAPTIQRYAQVFTGIIPSGQRALLNYFSPGTAKAARRWNTYLSTRV